MNASKTLTTSLDNAFLWLITAFPICDIITGFLIFRIGMPESFIGSPSQIIRIFFIFWGLFVIPYKKLILCTGILIWILAIESLSLFYVPSLTPFISGLNYGIKILYIVIFFISANQYCSKSYKAIHKFQLTIFNIAVIYALGVIVPTIFGIGVASYSEGTFGQKGLLASGNAVGIFLGIIYCLLILKIDKSLLEDIKLIVISIALVLLATKTALALLILGMLLALCKMSIKKCFIITALILSLIFINIDTVIDVVSTVADVILFRFENSESFFTFLMSSRDTYVADALEEFMQSPIWLFKFIIGGGAFMSFRPRYSDGMIFDTLENEFFDIFFMYGLIGLSVYMGLMIYFNIKVKHKSATLGFIFLLFCLHSIFAGHIIFDGIPIIAAVLIIQMAKYYNIEKRFFKI